MPLDEVLELAPAALRGDHERPVLHEAARIEEVVDVLAGGALPGAPPTLDGVGPRRVEADGVARPHLGEVGSLARRRHGGRRRGRRRSRRPALSTASTSPACTTSPAPDVHHVDRPGLGGVDRVLHLHRLDHRDLAAGGHGVAHLHDPDDRALERRADLDHRRHGHRRFYWLRGRAGVPVALPDHGLQPLPRSVNEKVVVYDGAFGTYVQTLGLGPDDFGSEHFEGCNELLVVTRPDVIATMHDDFFQVGVDVVETATFGAFAVPLAEYGIGERSHEINLAAARIAREVADGHGGLVAGSMGPGTKFASLGQIRFAELRDAYEEQAAGLLEGGVDLLLVETQFDLLGAKAGMIGCRRAMAAAGREVPIQVQVTMELTGTMLPGTEIGAALAALDAMRPDVIGINCATGPAEMSEHLRYLGQHSRVPIACLPNAGLPSVVEGQMHYDLTPEQLAEFQSRFVARLRRAGGGRLLRHHRRAHRRARRGASRTSRPAPRDFEHEDGATSIYSFTPFEQQLTYLSIGERTNANGSKKFREAMLEGDWDTVRGDGPRAGEGRRPRPRRLRRLRRPRRHRRHGRDRVRASPPRPPSRS